MQLETVLICIKLFLKKRSNIVCWDLIGVVMSPNSKKYLTAILASLGVKIIICLRHTVLLSGKKIKGS